ncbi:hypothetical protein CANARDRAFT_26636 [[Candida] arabinofermentans NRRL YB-2248]|uniref:Metacaspase-1 n=1 Tax=[Candida] arabinofermentans NRRL YB-2248 TaxID=983967 RepID=A0A1E4T622_9ASCO|nr:hypothetical protein CANARDRAFT_26636 [[Candida] arabinofermentans NRRL YB-2248]
MYPGNQQSGGYSRPQMSTPSWAPQQQPHSSSTQARPSWAPQQQQHSSSAQAPPSWALSQQSTVPVQQGSLTYQIPSSTPMAPSSSVQHQQVNGTNKVQSFQYSQCNGRKKALLIGINYIGSNNALRGCINDVTNMCNYLINYQGYSMDNIVILTDDQREMVKVPTKANMIRAMQWLVNGASPGDSLFFHYSGHGGQEEDQDGDEADGFDDCIYPVDFQQTGSLIDDVMHDIMVKPLPAGCRLTAIFDSCHSGTALDLPFIYRAQDGGIKEYNIWKESSGDAMGLLMGYTTNNTSLMMKSAMNVFKRVKNSSGNKAKEMKQQKMSPADVISLSGCKDSQTSADANEAGKFTGALSYALIKVLTDNPTQSYLTLLQNIRAVLAQKYTQKPQLSSSHQIDPNIKFIV